MTRPSIAEAWRLVADHARPGVLTRYHRGWVENVARLVAHLDTEHPLLRQWSAPGLADGVGMVRLYHDTLAHLELLELAKPESAEAAWVAVQNEIAGLQQAINVYDATRGDALGAAMALQMAAQGIAEKAEELARAHAAANVVTP